MVNIVLLALMLLGLRPVQADESIRDSGDFETRRLHTGLAVFLIVPVLLIGGVHWYVVAGVTTVGAIAALLQRADLRVWPPAAVLCASLALWTAMTAVPLPPAVLRAIAPLNAQLWQGALELTGQPIGRWNPVSLNPASSWLEVAKWSFYALVVVVSARVAKHRGLNPVLAVVWCAATSVALVTVFQAASGMDTVLGLYRPVALDRVGHFPTLLINPNNLAGYSNLGIFCGVGLAYSRRRRIPLPVILGGTLMCVTTTVLSASRSGNICLALGMCGLVAQWSTRALRTRGRAAVIRRLWDLAPIITVIMLGASVAALGGTSRIWQEMFDDDLSKANELPILWSAVPHHWAVGVGRGAFETVAFLHLPESTNVVRQSVENFPLGWLLEWGVLVGGAALLALGWLLRPGRFRLAGRRPAEAAYAGVLVLLVQNLADLGLEVLSLTAACFALLGALEGSRADRGIRVAGRATRSLHLIVPAMTILGATFAWVRGPDVYSVRRELSQIAAMPERTEELARRVSVAVTRRPAEPYFFLLGAQAAVRSGRDAMPWAAALLERAPNYGRAHFVVAEALLQRGARGQALLHLQLAAGADPSLSSIVASRALALSGDFQMLERAVPPGPDGVAVLLEMTRRSPDRLTRRQLLQKAREVAPDDIEVRAELAMELLEDLRTGTKPCSHDDSGCRLMDAERIRGQLARDAKALAGMRRCEGLQLEAHLLALEGQKREAVRVLGRCNECDEPTHCGQLRVDIAQDLNAPLLRREVENAYIAGACSDNAACARARFFVGTRAMNRGAWLAAYEHFYAAARRRPEEKRFWLAAARAAAKAGHETKARHAYERARELGVARDEGVETTETRVRLD